MVDHFFLFEFIRFLVCLGCYSFCSFVVCRSSSSSAQVGLIVLLILVLVSARVEINRVYIYGHPVADDDGGVTHIDIDTPFQADTAP